MGLNAMNVEIGDTAMAVSLNRNLADDLGFLVVFFILFAVDKDEAMTDGRRDGLLFAGLEGSVRNAFWSFLIQKISTAESVPLMICNRGRRLSSDLHQEVRLRRTNPMAINGRKTNMHLFMVLII